MLTDDQIESLAEQFRIDVAIEHDFIPNMLEVLDKMKRQDMILDVQFFPDGQFGMSEAYYAPDTRTMHLSHTCARKQMPQHRFTVAHEIAHLLAGHKFTRHRRVDHGQQFGSEVKKNEREADKIAAAILVPEKLADVDMLTSARTLANRFGVSLSMANYRLKTLQERYRIRHGIQRKPLPPVKLAPDGSIVLAVAEKFDTGDYNAAAKEMARNARRWNGD
ncbi:ImmA/IrrE family metallo-endopeptidase [Pelagibacterium nitratireducens]|uniref:ImmA/IrrE family metallo-endopeptidase n=1 Tax=Pelagibacterium nitratireducens TaxID=1046114 RepID=A0ABZ2I9K2_9HYPH